MNNISRIVTALAVATAGALFTACAQTLDTKPGIVETNVVTVTATVEAVDAATRTVTLKGPEGRLVHVKAGEEVRNFDQIRQGDKVKVEYAESTVVYVRPGGAPPAATESSAIAVAPKGKKPLLSAVATVEITANVEAIDHKKRTVTLKGPRGNVMTFNVHDSVRNFDQVRKGDQVVVRHTETIAVRVSK